MISMTKPAGVMESDSMARMSSASASDLCRRAGEKRMEAETELPGQKFSHLEEIWSRVY